MSSPNHAATILVIDDHVALAQGFAQALTGAGYTVLIAHNADVARCAKPSCIDPTRSFWIFRCRL